jgi:hypothetical protein
VATANGVRPPLRRAARARHTLEFVFTAVLELDARAGHQVPDRAGHQDLGRFGERGHPLTDVHGYPTDISVADLDLAGVQADTNIQVQVRSRVADGARAANRTRRPIKRDQEAVTDHLHLAASERTELTPDRGVVGIEEVPPSTVAEGCRSLR